MMTPEVLEATIDGLCQRSPFHPFTLMMTNGSRLEVDHPKAVHFYRGFGVFYGPGGLPNFFETGGVNHVARDLSGNVAEKREAA